MRSLSIFGLVMFGVIVVTQIASAYYDPNLQRWINRDPLQEPGFEHLRQAGARQLRREAASQYPFVGNNPITEFDLLGLDRPAPGSYGVPLKRAPTQLLPCWADFLDTYAMIKIGNSGYGYGSFPVANDDDRLQHCITSCKLARACGRLIAWALGQLKETSDLLHGGSTGDTTGDLGANKVGRSGCKSNKSCEEYCQENRGNY